MAMLNGNVEYKQTAEYRDAVARSERRSSDHRRQLSKARALSRKAEIGLWDALTQEEQDLVEAYGGGHLERELQHLVSQKAPIYRGVATSVSDLQRCQRGLLTRACSIAAPLSSAPHSLMSLLCWKINGSTASPHGLTLV